MCAATTRRSGAVNDWPDWSEMTMGYRPSTATSGVPEISPVVALSDSPLGSGVDPCLNAYGFVPPAAVGLSTVGCPTCRSDFTG